MTIRDAMRLPEASATPAAFPPVTTISLTGSPVRISMPQRPPERARELATAPMPPRGTAQPPAFVLLSRIITRIRKKADPGEVRLRRLPDMLT